MEPQPFALTMQEEMIHDVESARPEYVVVVTGGGSWAQRRGRQRSFLTGGARIGPGHYKRVGLVDIISYDHTEYRWGGDVGQLRGSVASHCGRIQEDLVR